MGTILLPRHHSIKEMLRLISNKEFDANISAFGDYGGGSFRKNISYDGIKEYEKEDGGDIHFSGRILT